MFLVSMWLLTFYLIKFLVWVDLKKNPEGCICDLNKMTLSDKGQKYHFSIFLMCNQKINLNIGRIY